MKKTALISALFFALPLAAFAQNLDGLISLAFKTLNALIPLLMLAALVVFFWGLVKYVWNSGEGHEAGQNTMIAGIVALFVMASVWGIVRFLQSTFSIEGNNSLPGSIPQIQPNNGVNTQTNTQTNLIP